MATGAAWLNGKKIMAPTANPKVCLDIDRPSHRRSYSDSRDMATYFAEVCTIEQSDDFLFAKFHTP
jgi:hypothetical protein